MKMRMLKTTSLELCIEVAIMTIHGIAPYYRFHPYVYALVFIGK